MNCAMKIDMGGNIIINWKNIKKTVIWRLANCKCKRKGTINLLTKGCEKKMEYKKRNRKKEHIRIESE